MRYPIIVHNEPDRDYGVTVPDLPGCFSGGETMDEAIENAVEAIGCHIEGLLVDGEMAPRPQSGYFHNDNTDCAGGEWAVATVDVAKLWG